MEKPNIFSSFKKDALAGLIVFLIALPLCLGIAQACHAPPFAGIVAGIIGGLVVGTASCSNLSVTGPAAGLTAIVLAAITKFNSFEIFLCSVMIGGAIQVALGFLRAGSIANYIPTSVLEGMLAGIGLTIIIKQVPEAVGYAVKNDVMVDAEDGIVAKTINMAVHHTQTGAMVVAAVGLFILVLWQTKPFKKLQLIPAGLLVVVIGTLINYMFQRSNSPLVLDNNHLVKLPVANSASEFFGQFAMPDWKGFQMAEVWKTGIVLAIVASIETLLCVEATDKLDPLKRYTPTNRELKAQGLGNLVSGLVGGLPVTSVIVRSSANVNAGARTKLSTIIHGTLLLVCVATIPVLLNQIPKAALAAILIFTGYRLCRPEIFKHMWKGGMTQFIPFIATLAGVVGLDLLKGVGIGIVISIIYILRQNLRIPYYYQRSSYSNGELIKLTLAQEVSFLNKASIKETLNKLPENSNVIIDAGETQYIDFDVLELIKDFQATQAIDKNITLSLLGFKNIYQIPETQKPFSDMLNGDEVPKRSAGTYRKLLDQLSRTANKKQ